MFTRLQKKIKDLRQAPEDVRMRAAIRYTAIGGAIILILWLVVFLPFQLHNIF